MKRVGADKILLRTKLMLPFVVLVIPLLLLGCGSKCRETAYVQSNSGFQVNSSNSTAGSSSTTTTNDTGETSTPVLPPQPVLGSYLAASFETPDSVNRGACAVSVSEGKDTFSSSLASKPYQLVPIARAELLSSVTIDCIASTSSVMFSASMNLNNSDRELISTMLVSQLNEPVKFVVRFSSGGSTHGNNESKSQLVLEKVEIGQLVNAAQDNAAGAGSAPNSPETAPSPAAPDAPESAIDVTPPQVLGIRIVDHPTDSKLRILQISGASDNVRLADLPYSFDGGKVWTKTNSVTVARRIYFDKSLIVVRDAAGNQTQLQGMVYTDN